MDGDTFMRTDSKADKWLILELPQVIRPDTLRVRYCSAKTQDADLSHLHAGSTGVAEDMCGCMHPLAYLPLTAGVAARAVLLTH